MGVRSSNHFDDGYFGSGKYLKRAIQKYGIENFTKKILWVFGTAEEAYKKESEIVTESFVNRKDTYNLATGGKGGWLGEEVNKKRSQSLMNHVVSDETKIKIGKSNTGNSYRRGYKASEETKKKISESRKGITPWNKGVPWSEDMKLKLRKPHKSTGPKTRLSCVGCGKETTVNSFWRHKNC